MAFSIGSNYLLVNSVAPGTFQTTTAPGGGAPTGQMHQMNDGKNQYINVDGTSWNKSQLILADAGDVIHLTGAGWNEGVYSSTEVANGVGTVNGKLYTNAAGDQVFITGGAKVDKTDSKGQANKDALKADINTIENGSNVDNAINKDELTAGINKFSGAKKAFWETVLSHFDSLKDGNNLINVDILANKNYSAQA